nr:ADP-ribosylation factor-like protein 4D [Nothobranchius furzeri]
MSLQVLLSVLNGTPSNNINAFKTGRCAAERDELSAVICANNYKLPWGQRKWICSQYGGSIDGLAVQSCGCTLEAELKDSRRKCMEEAKVELHKITRTSENQGVPVLILANKQDQDSALSVSEVEKLLSVHELSMYTLYHVQGCSAVDGQGLQAGLEKLYEMIVKRKKTVKHNRNSGLD